MSRHRTTGWVPDQHGAWVMVTVPLILGIFIAGPTLADLPLAIAWFSGYFAFFALGLWLKVPAKRKATFRPPLVTYGAISAAASLAVIALAPRVLIAAAWFGPLVAIATYEAWKKRPRSLASGLATTIASAGLMPVCGLVQEPGTVQWQPLLAATALIAAYQAGTILFVKTMIRNRGQAPWLAASVAYHLLIAAAAAVAAATGYLANYWPAIILCGVALRAIAMPYASTHRDKPLSPKFVGLTEGVWVIAVVDAILVGI